MKFEDKLIRRLDTVYRRTFNLPRKDSAEDVFHSITQVTEDGRVVVNYGRLRYTFNNGRNFERYARAVGAFDPDEGTIPEYVEYIEEEELGKYLLVNLVNDFDAEEATEESTALYESAIEDNLLYVWKLQNQVIENSDKDEDEWFEDQMRNVYEVDADYTVESGEQLLDDYRYDIIPEDSHEEIEKLVEARQELEGKAEGIIEGFSRQNELTKDFQEKLYSLVFNEEPEFREQGLELVDTLSGQPKLKPLLQKLHIHIEEAKEEEKAKAQETWNQVVRLYRHQIEQDWEHDWHWDLEDQLERYWTDLDHEHNLGEIIESDSYQEEFAEKSSVTYNEVLRCYQRVLHPYIAPSQFQLFGA